MNHKDFGNQGEDFAAQYLEKRGCRILERQFRSPMGEIDIIAEEKNTILFVEVKTRRPTHYGIPAQAVGRTKQRRIIRTAVWYMQEKRIEEKPCRFDVAEVLYERGSYTVQYYENAFEAGACGC